MKNLILAIIITAVLLGCGNETGNTPQEPRWVAHEEKVVSYTPTADNAGILITTGGSYLIRTGGPAPMINDTAKVNKFEPSTFHLVMIEGINFIAIGEIQK